MSAQLEHLLADAGKTLGVVGRSQRLHNPLSDMTHLVRTHTAGGYCRRTHANAGRVCWLSGIEGNHVFIHGNGALGQHGLGLPARQSQRGYIGQQQMIVRAAASQPKPAGQKLFGQNLGVLDYLLDVGPEAGLKGLAETDGLAGDNVHERAALKTGKYAPVEVPGVLFSAQDQTASGPPEGLMGSARDIVSHRNRVVMEAGGYQAGIMGHIHEQFGPYLMGDLGESGVRDFPRIGAGPGHDQPGFMLPGKPGQLVKVNPMIVRSNPVTDKMEKPTGSVQPHPVRKMPPMGQVQPQDHIAWF